VPNPNARSGDGFGLLGVLGCLTRRPYALGALVRLGLHRRLVYAYLFAFTHRQALSQLPVSPFDRYVPRRGRVAEYGCAARILSGLAGPYRHLDLQLGGAHIPHLLCHYARWRVRDNRFVIMVPVEPKAHGTASCLETLEHLPRPIPVPQHFHRVLKPREHPVFDYVRSDSTRLDTATWPHFDIVYGPASTDGSHVEASAARQR
jgi:hypothetical protein